MNVPLWFAAPVVLLVALATWADVRTRKIPNSLTGLAFLLAVGVHWGLGGAVGVRSALLGGLIAGLLLFPGWLMGFTGAGDVKLMAAVGAWLGFPGGLKAAAVALIAGGVIAILVAARRGVLVQAVKGAAALGLSVLARRGGVAIPRPVTTGVRFPFAPAILIGAIYVLMRTG